MISRWSCMACPRCGTRLSRRLDLQFLSVTAPLSVALVGALVLALASPAVGLMAGMLSLAVAWVADALTVRLVAAGRWVGWGRGYEA
jgi:hypothetical protein